MVRLRIPLVLAGLYLSIASAFSQTVPAQDSVTYKQRKLKIEEINFVTSYYHQEGNNAAVTGGIGSERLSDYATTFDIKLSKRDYKNRIHTVNGELGIDFIPQHHLTKLILLPFLLRHRVMCVFIHPFLGL